MGFRAAFLLLFLTLSAQGVSRLDTAVTRLDGSYPWRRIAEGVPTIAYGAVTALGGLWIMLDSSHHNNGERTVGAIASLTGAVLFFDSIASSFGKSSGEHLLDHYREMPANGDGLFASKDAYAEAALKRFADTGRSSRLVRGAVSLANAIPYFYFYFENKTRYRNAQYLGAGLVALALYRFFIPSPEENAASVLFGANSAAPLGVSVAWRF